MSEHFVDHVKEFKRGLVVELYHRQVHHEGRSVQTVHDQLDLVCVEVGRLGKDLRAWFLAIATLYLAETLESLLHFVSVTLFS